MSKLVQDTVSSVSYNIENVLYNSRKFVKHISGPAPKKKKTKWREKILLTVSVVMKHKGIY